MPKHIRFQKKNIFMYEVKKGLSNSSVPLGQKTKQKKDLRNYEEGHFGRHNTSYPSDLLCFTEQWADYMRHLWLKNLTHRKWSRNSHTSLSFKDCLKLVSISKVKQEILQTTWIKMELQKQYCKIMVPEDSSDSIKCWGISWSEDKTLFQRERKRKLVRSEWLW